MGKYNFENGDCYIGKFKYGLREGKGIQFFSDGNIEFEGEFVNDKINNGKLISKNRQHYYIGNFENNKFNSEGKIFLNGNNNNALIYKGNFTNGKFEGNGKFIFKETNEYYIGNFKEGLRNGKGYQYYNNGRIQYEGIWNNDKRNGSGKYYYGNGDYFIGFWKDGVKVGIGELYDKNGNIIKGGDVSQMNIIENNSNININDFIFDNDIHSLDKYSDLIIM